MYTRPNTSGLDAATAAIVNAICNVTERVLAARSRAETPAPAVIAFTRNNNTRTWSVRTRMVGFVMSPAPTDLAVRYVLQVGTEAYQFICGSTDAQARFIPFPITIEPGVDFGVWATAVGTQISTNGVFYIIAYPEP